MARQLQRQLLAATARHDAGSVTGEAPSDPAPERCAAGLDANLFGDVEPRLRIRMELLARASASPDAALPHVVALLVDGAAARDAIVEAINANDPLREQWLRTWEALRR